MSTDGTGTAESLEPEPEPEQKGFVQRMLDGIERVGNKVPHPAIIFLGLVGLVIVLSAILSAFDVSVTYDVAEQPPLIAEEEYVGGSIEPEAVIPPEEYLDDEIEIVAGDHLHPQPARRRRHPVHLLLVRQQLRQLQRGGRRVRRDDRRRRRRGGRVDGGAHPQARQGRPREAADVHHRARRRALQRRHRRRVPHPDPARRGGVPQRRPPPARRPGRGLRRRERRASPSTSC